MVDKSLGKWGFVKDVFCFFFQAEDGIRVADVTGVQTCALPISIQLKDYGVVNIGAAGTFVVRRPISKMRLCSELLRNLPFEAEVMTCTGQELIAAASANPFDDELLRSEIVRFVSVLAKPPQVPASIPIRIPEKGKWLVKVLAVH